MEVDKRMEQPLISVIVPIYNVENYLRGCLDSIYHQSYKNFEVILVDDGSTDSSSDICQEYLEKDSRFIYFRKENGGLSDARNVGLKLCKGEYVSFVDSDDTINPDYLSLLYTNLVEYDADMAMINHLTYVEESWEYLFSNYPSEPPVELLTVEDVVNRQASDPVNQGLFVVAWAKLFKKTFFENVQAPVGRIFEDEASTHQLYLLAKKGIVFIHSSAYMHRVRSGSIMETRSDKLLKAAEDILYAFDRKLVDLMLAGIDVTLHKNNYVNVLRNYKEQLENSQLTDNEWYHQIVYRLGLVE